MSDNHTHTETPENCTHDCSTCGEACAQHEPESLQQPLRPGSRVDKVIAVVSGKGGVGKSTRYGHAGLRRCSAAATARPCWMPTSPARPSRRPSASRRMRLGGRGASCIPP